MLVDSSRDLRTLPDTKFGSQALSTILHPEELRVYFLLEAHR